MVISRKAFSVLVLSDGNVDNVVVPCEKIKSATKPKVILRLENLLLSGSKQVLIKDYDA